MKMDQGQNEFFAYWFSGFINGLEKVDENSQNTILQACGTACAQSYTAQIFQQARQQSSDLESFLALLAVKFPGASYQLITERTISVEYKDCACDLVKLGWVKNPILCKCSANNLQQNFRAALKQPVRVRLISSILGGAELCKFEVTLGDGDE
jgi:predicted ArsR family transcriptional regulator